MKTTQPRIQVNEAAYHGVHACNVYIASFLQRNGKSASNVEQNEAGHTMLP